MDPRFPVASAMAIKDGAIVAIGDYEDIRDHCDAATVRVAEGTFVVPGLIDAHHHPVWSTKFALGVDASAVRTAAELKALLEPERRRIGGEAVLRAWGLDHEVFAKCGFTGAALEQLAAGPALISTMDCHTYLATPDVLRLAGIDGAIAFDDGAEVVIDAGGRPTGELREFSAFDLVAAALPQLSPAEARGRLRETLETLASLGLTTVHAMDGAPSTYELLDELEAEGELPIRLVVPLWIKPTMDDDLLDLLARLVDVRGRRWRGAAAKFFLDGVVENGTAWLEEPDAEGDCTDSIWPSAERFAEVVGRFSAAGFGCATHAVGDRAIRETLDAYRDATRVAGVRHRIEHLEVLADPELRRLAAEGVIASVQPLHMQWRLPDSSDVWSRRLGPERAGRVARVRDMLQAGVTLALGSDWPVAGRDPRLGMAWARLRRPPGERDAPVFEPAQALSAHEALAGYTVGAAAAVGEEHLAGRLAPGLRADLTAFAADPLLTSGDDLVELPVAMTAVAGEITYRAPGAPL